MNEPAFPGLHPSKECHYQDAGMSLRDYFAAKAMLGVITDPHHDVAEGYDTVASYAYSLADAMLAAREQK